MYDEVGGCQDESASNYDANATDAGDCEFAEPAAGTAIADCGDFAAGPNAHMDTCSYSGNCC